ncbi:tetratricopeptide repeat protein [Marinomonas epiphytica]
MLLKSRTKKQISRAGSIKNSVLLSVICFSLSACQTTEKSISPVVSKPRSAPTDETEVSRSSSEFISALLAAEFTLQREGADAAYPQFYALASEYRDPKLIRQLSQVAIATQNTSRILHSTDLWLTLEPKSSQAYALKFQILIKADQKDSAAALLTSAEQNQVELVFLPAYLEQHISDEKVVHCISETLKALPKSTSNNHQVILTAARLSYLNGEFQASVDAIDKLSKEQPDSLSENAYLISAYSHEKLGQSSEAIKTLQASLQRHPNSQLTLSPLLELLTIGGQAEQAYSLYLEHAPESENAFTAGIQFGRILLANKHPQLALNVIRQLPRSQPGLNEQKVYLEAVALFELGKTNQAIETMLTVQGALKANATEQTAKWLYHDQRENEINAIAIQRLSRENAPEELATISRLHNQFSNQKLSFELLSQALLLYPESDSVRYQKALLADLLGNWQEAEKEFLWLLQKDPLNPRYLNALGYTLLVRTTRVNEAMDYIEQAYEQSSNDPAIIDSLGWGFFIMGELEQAAYYLKKAWTILPDPEIAAHYGEALWAQKNYQQAVNVWQAALSQSPDAPILQETINRLSPSLFQYASQPTDSKDN